MGAFAVATDIGKDVAIKAIKFALGLENKS